MTLNLIGKIVMPTTINEANFYEKENDVIRTQIDELLDKSDVVKVSLKNGKEYFLAEVNKLCGVCDDCTNFRRADIATYAFYKE